jgi:transcriptional regulator
MYLPTAFEESRPDVLHALIRSHPLGLLVTQGESGLQANSIPFEVVPAAGDAPALLRAHVARANPVWRETAASAEVLVVFQGPQAYVSPGWYATKAETGKVVPTWNYVMVQARGGLKIVDESPWLHALVSRLTHTHEASQDRPWAVADAPDDYVATMLRAIVGIEIELTSLQGKWKVSQNRADADRVGVARALSEQTGEQAQAMARQVRAPGAV